MPLLGRAFDPTTLTLMYRALDAAWVELVYPNEWCFKRRISAARKESRSHEPLSVGRAYA